MQELKIKLRRFSGGIMFDKSQKSRRLKNQIKVFSAAHIKSSASAHASEVWSGRKDLNL
jgi:hypothetical protein